MSATLLGSSDAVAGNPIKTWTREAGEKIEQVWIGTSAAVETVYNTAKAQNAGDTPWDSLVFDYGKGVGVLRGLRTPAADEAAGTPNADYELVPNEFNKPLELNSYFSSVSAGDILTLRKAFDAAVDPSEIGFADSTKQYELYVAWCEGNEEYPESGYVLRKTITTSNRSSVRASYTSVNKVLTDAAMKAESGYANFKTLIGFIPAGEWLKKSPSVVKVGANKYRLSQEYWWAEAWGAWLH